MQLNRKLLAISIAGALISTGTQAAVPHTFTAGSPAKAAEVNANFSDVDTKAMDAQTKATNAEAAVQNLTSEVSTLTSEVTSLQSSTATKTELGALTIDVTTLETEVSTKASQADLTSLTDTVTNLSASSATKTALDALELKVDNLPTGSAESNTSVSVDVDCTSDSKALITAYNANSAASTITFNLTGSCEGDFQGAPVTSRVNGYEYPGFAKTKNLFLNGGSSGAAIIPNVDSGFVNLVASASVFELHNIDITTGADEAIPVRIMETAKASFTDTKVTGVDGTGTLIFVSRASSLYAKNLTLDSEVGSTFGGTFAGVRAYYGSSVAIDGLSSTNVVNSIKAVGGAVHLEGTQVHGGITIEDGSNAVFLGNAVISATGLTVQSEGVVRSYSGSTLDVSGNVSVNDGGNLLSRNLTVGGNLNVNSSFYRNVGGLDISGSFIIRRASTARILDGSLNDIYVRGNSTLLIEARSSSPASVTGSVDVYGASYLSSQNTTFDMTVNADSSSTASIAD